MPAPVIAYGLFCIFWGNVNACYIKADGPVLHWANLILHAVTCGYFGLSVHWALGLAMFFEARPLFDLSLYLTRFGWKGLRYVSPDPASTIDRLEKAIFGWDGITPKVLYAALCFVFLHFFSR